MCSPLTHTVSDGSREPTANFHEVLQSVMAPGPRPQQADRFPPKPQRPTKNPTVPLLYHILHTDWPLANDSICGMRGFASVFVLCGWWLRYGGSVLLPYLRSAWAADFVSLICNLFPSLD